MAVISNYFDNALVSGTSADDSLSNAGNVNSVYDTDEDGNEYWDHDEVNYANGSTVDAGGGNDYIYNDGANVSVNAGAGDDTIQNVTSETYGEEETYEFIPENATLDGGTGNDTIANDANGVLINGGAGSDTITNSGENATDVSINGGAGYDYIFNEGSNAVINGDDGNDNINNDADNAVINGGASADTITSNGDYVYINGGDDDDVITDNGSYDGSNTIAGGAGNDTININSENALITYSYGDGNDLIKGFRENSTLQILTNTIDKVSSNGTDLFLTIGDSTITLEGAYGLSLNIVDANGNEITFEINGAEGDSSITNNLSNATINGGSGNDTIENYGENAVINGGDGNDNINNNADNVAINGGSGADTITSNGDYVYINGGDDDDVITDNGSYYGEGTINGGAGNDTININSDNALITYSYGDGNDLITGFRENSTLKIMSGTVDSVSSNGKDLFVAIGDATITLANAYEINDADNVNIVNATDGSYAKVGVVNLAVGRDTLENYFNNVTINAFDGNDTISNYGENVVINGGTGADYIYNEGSNAVINGDDGNDNINNNADNVAINGGSGADTITSNGDYVYINGGDGNDVITDNGGYYDSNTIDGGAGNDTININSENALITYNAGDGNDLITGFRENSTLKIMSGAVDSVSSNGEDLFVAVGDATITLEGAYYAINNADNLNIINPDGSYAKVEVINLTSYDDSLGNNFHNVAINALEGDDVISNSGENVVINGDAGNDEIYNNSDGYNAVINGGNGDDYITNDADKVTMHGGAGVDEITNNGDYAKIDGGAGDDEIISNGGYYGDGGTISGGKGNDLINVSNSTNALINYNAGDGNDTIIGFDETNTLAISADSYTSVNSGNNVVIYVGGNHIVLKDATTLESINITLCGPAAPDTITPEIKDDTPVEVTNSESDIEILGSTDNDYIVNKADNVSIWTGAGNDEIENSGSNVYIHAGEDSDTITNYSGGKNTTIDGSDGDDYIENNGANASISGGAGDDSISNEGSNVLFKYDAGDGNDFIGGFNETSTLQIMSGSIVSATWIDDEYLVLDMGQGRITLATSFEESSKFNIIDAYGNPIGFVINGTSNSDEIINYNDDVTIDAGAGNDFIENYGSDVSINGGIGNDEISNGEENPNVTNVTIDGGAGNDFISNYGDNALIDGGTGDDYIDNEGSDVTINGGTGDDYVGNDGSYTTFQYTEGDGNDTIYGFNATSTLQIGGGSGTYSMQVSGSDIIVTVGDGSIILSQAASLSDVNISGEEILSNPVWSISGTTATYGVPGNEPIITINGVNSTEGLSLDGTTVTVANSALNGTDVTISDGYTLKLADDVPITETTTPHWIHRQSTAVYQGTSTTEGYTLASDGRSISYTAEFSEGDLITITGVNVNFLNALNVNGNVVTVSASALNQGTVTISPSSYTLALADDVTKTSTTGESWTLSGTTATHKAAQTFAGYSVNANNQIVYTAASGGETFTVTGVRSTSGLSLNGNVVTVAASALNQGTVTVSNGYTIALASDVTAPSTTAESWTLSGTTATHKAAQTFAGYSVNANNQIVYTAASGGETFNVMGVKDTAGLSLNGNVVTVAASALNQGIVTVSNGYTLALASDVTAPSTTGESWTLSGTTATHKAAQTFAGYSVNANNQIVYTAASGGETFNVMGVKDTAGLSLNGNVVTVSASALNNANVTVSDGYTLQLASDVTAPVTTPAAWNFSNNIATYKAAAISEGYSVNANNQIVYTAASGGNDVVTITGVKSAEGLSINGNVVMVAASALNQGTVTVSDGYTLALANDVATPASVAAEWTQNGTTATYKGVSKTAGYTLSSDGLSINYEPAEEGETIVVSGVRSTDGLTLEGTTVTVSDSALNAARVTISDGYTLALGDDVTKSTTTSENLSLSGSNTAIYISEATSAGYKLENDQLISYVRVSGGDEVEITGVKSIDGITVDGDTITISRESLNREKVTLSNDGYTLALASDVSKPVKAKEGWSYDTETSTASFNTEFTTEGYELEDNEITYTPAITGDVIVEVTGVKDTEGLLLVEDEKVVAVYAAALGTEDVTISEGYTLELGSDVEEGIDYAGHWTTLENGNVAYQAETSAGYKLKNNKISYVELTAGETLVEMSGIDISSPPTLDSTGITLAANNFEDNVEVVTASSDIRNFELTAGDYDKAFTATEKADKINNVGNHIAIDGGAGNDKINSTGSDVTVTGGLGDDNISLSGGENDANLVSYASGDGKDIIYNFGGSDKIQITGTATIEENIKNKDVVFKVGKGSLTVRNAAQDSLTIALVGESDNDVISENTYTTNGIISKGKIELSATLKKPYTQAENISEVDAGKVKDGAAIIGNSSGGTLTGGDGKDTLRSSDAEFELEGGKGNDVFVYGGGNDTITDYSQSGTDGADKISVASGLNYNDYEIEGENVILSYGDGNTLTLTKGKGKEITFAGKKTEVKRYEDIGVFENKNKSLKLDKNLDGSLDTSKGKDYSKLVTIDGSAVSNDLEIKGNSKANYIVAGKSNTTLNGGKGKDTLVGSEGKDTFIYENKSGNKTIQDYSFVDDDVVSLASGAEITQVTTKGKNAVLKVGSNTITIENTALFNFIENGVEKTYYDGNLVNEDGDSVTLESNFKGTFDLNAEGNEIYKNVSAELGKKAVTLKGDEDDNILTGGKGKDALYGGDNNDTLNGGKGNDSLWGNDGADTFVYYAGDGTDTIKDYNYEDGDLLQIFDKRGKEITSKQVKKWKYDGDDLTLSINGGGKLVLEGIGKSAKVKFSNGNEQSF